MAKRAGSTYHSGSRTEDWLKIKTSKRQEVVIAGYTAPRRTRPFFGALVLAVREKDSWRYIGHVGTGFSHKTLEELHERETKGQVKRLDRVFKIIGKPARGKTCAAINGISEEGSEIMKDFKGMPALDAGLLASAQAVEHYEISRYGTLSTCSQLDPDGHVLPA